MRSGHRNLWDQMSTFEPHVSADHEEMSRRAADWLVDRLRERADALLCLATGATPMRTYAMLADRGRAEPKTF